jgi:hypothetical protein
MTTPDRLHFSAFALDVHRALWEAPDPVLEEHLRECAQCRAYLDQLDALGSVPAPAWTPPRGRSAKRAGWGLTRSRWVTSLASAAVLVAGVVVWNSRERWTSASYVGVKGTPAVQVLVRSGDQTRIWDGQSPVHPGDALALRVACEGFAHVVVTGVSQSGAWARLFDGTCPADPSPLPFTLIPDEQPVQERIAVVLSTRPLDENSLSTVVGTETRSSDVWVVRLTFAKQVKP